MIWFFNTLLYILFMMQPLLYHQSVAAGAPCWIQADGSQLPVMGLGDRGTIQPGCFYDPSNRNDGHATNQPAFSKALRLR